MAASDPRDQKYFDYLELHDTAVPGTTATTPSQRKPWLAAVGSVLLLAGASVAYTSNNANLWTDIKGLVTPKTTGANAAVPTMDLLGASAAAPCNRVKIAFQSGVIKDGTVQYATVSVPEQYRADPPPCVQLSAPGIKLAQSKFYFDKNDPTTYEQLVPCRTESGSTAKSGAIVPVTVTLTYPTTTYAPQKQPVQRQLMSSGRCSAWGDPHVTSFDGAVFDFQKPGVFRYVSTRNFVIQVFQEWCPPTSKGDRAPSCYKGVAIAYADSVVRLFLKDNKIQLIKGSESLRWLDVYKLGGKTQGFRVFTTVDQSSYVDVTMGMWVQNYGYMNIAFQASPFFKDPSLTGIMGNWNGNRADDVRDAAKLTAAHGLSLTENLFTCTGDACDLQPATEEDELALLVPLVVPTLRNGYVAVDPATIPLEAYTPTGNLPATVAMARELASDDDGNATATATTDAVVDDRELARRALELCEQAISSVPDCDKYVPNKSFFIYNVCVEDAILVGDLSVVDNTKIDYLRECRREMEAELELQGATAPEKQKELTHDRAELEFGDLKRCPENCRGKGDCLAAGCKCHAGYTGYTCDIRV